MDQVEVDIIIVGAGMAGSIAAYLLGKQGRSVILLDRQANCPPVFRAEKLELDQVVLLKTFGLLESRRPLAKPIGDILSFDAGAVVKLDTSEQYGIRYHDTVNQIRSCALNYVDFRVARVQSVRAAGQCQEVVIDDGEVLIAKLVVLACGYNSSLLSKVGVVSKSNDGLRSLSFGFDMASKNSSGFSFNGFNYHAGPEHLDVDYITIFKIGDTMRANLFTRYLPRDSYVKRFMSSPYDALRELFPRLLEHIGEFEITSKIEIFSTGYYQSVPPKVPGIVMLGDAFQSVSPTTGTGLSKVFNDVDVLCNTCVPKWFETQGMGLDKTSSFYEYSQKLNADKYSYGAWQYYCGNSGKKSYLGSVLGRLKLLGLLRYLKGLVERLSK